jgi:hypothetical protein
MTDHTVYEVFIDSKNSSLYFNFIGWREVFSMMSPSLKVNMKTLILVSGDESFYGKILSRPQERFDGELVMLKAPCTGDKVVDTITSTGQDVYEYHAYLSEDGVIDSVAPTSFIIYHSQVDQYFKKYFLSTLLEKLINIAQEHQNYLIRLNSKFDLVCKEEVNIDIFDFIYAKLCKEAEEYNEECSDSEEG